MRDPVSGQFVKPKPEEDWSPSSSAPAAFELMTRLLHLFDGDERRKGYVMEACLQISFRCYVWNVEKALEEFKAAEERLKI